MTESRRKIVVGVVDERSRHVIETAAWYASQFDATLVCAMIVPDPYGLGEAPAGYLGMMRAITPSDPPVEMPPGLVRVIEEAVEPHGVPWAPFTSIGTPARELTALAERIDALMFVLGTREGVRGMVREALNGSVAAQLAHRHNRPVVVVPQDPIGFAQADAEGIADDLGAPGGPDAEAAPAQSQGPVDDSPDAQEGGRSLSE
ncbi:universal stress protein [Brachybacterium nesterenkovii]|uniref:UspA domain-containing protein n=1 Tax=Brachybacterium nesterenkovii TaxID=47847 RepID=A0A1X6WT23_9MICO|nr:hypothetical protein, putative universal stress protein UspA [Brachybacterium nesterenkovii]